MAVSDTNPTIIGMGTNPGLLLPATDYKATDAQIVYDTDYMFGKAVRGVKSGQKLMETQWFPEGVMNNIVTPILYIQNATGATTRLDELIVYVYKRDRDGVQYPPSELRVKYRQYISDTVGGMPYYHLYERTAMDYRYFDPRYQYKFVISVGKLTADAVLDLEAMYLDFHERNAVVAARQTSWTSPADGSRPAEAVPYIEGITWSCKSDAGGQIEVIFPVEMFDSGLGSWSGYWGVVNQGSYYGDYDTDGTVDWPGAVRGMPNAIDGIVTNFAGGYYGPAADTSTSINTDYIAAPYGGGYVPFVLVDGLTANTVYYFRTILFGFMGARQI